MPVSGRNFVTPAMMMKACINKSALQPAASNSSFSCGQESAMQIPRQKAMT